jgi:hypothetical protein
MLNHTALYARDLLRIALDLLEDEESLTAVAMISGAIEVLDHNTEPAQRPVLHWKMADRRAVRPMSRSCA